MEKPLRYAWKYCQWCGVCGPGRTVTSQHVIISLQYHGMA